MGIDRIGKGGGVTPPPDVEKAGKSGAVDKPFTAERASHAAAVDPTQATSPLAQLKAGQIDVERYLDLKVEEATKALHGVLPAELDDIKKMLRDQLASDPGLTDLVRAATGAMPKPPED